MQIKRLVIENFKSIERIELIEPNPFTVFVGPNGSGKSNIFEALEFGNRLLKSYHQEAFRLFGGSDALMRRGGDFTFSIIYDSDGHESLQQEFNLTGVNSQKRADINLDNLISIVTSYPLVANSNRLALYEKKPRIDYPDDATLTTNASNLEPVLKRILNDSILREEIFEWLDLFVPGFKAVEIDDRDELQWFEEGSDRYFTKGLISDGTYNLLALLTAIYQSDEPQFLCIEEPENGLHPQVQMTLVEFFRKICLEKGHYIWLNTHSEAIVRKLTTDEIVLVDKVDGITKTKQTKGRNIYDLPTDEAWLTGTLGGGLPW